MTAPELPPLYDTPAANATREAAITVYTQYEPLLYAGYLKMITGWLDQVKATVLNHSVKALALVPDPYSVFSKTADWNTLVDRYTETTVRHVLDAAYHSVLGETGTFASRPFVHNFIANSSNKMKQVPTEVHAIVKQIIDSAVTNGATIPDITNQIEQALSATGTDTWKNRAATVARTEVHSAYVGGLHDAYSMVVEADPTTQWVHRWLATEDERTRPTHREADGQTVPAGSPFHVGDALLMYPGDPTGPASEIINCRCVELLEEADQPTNMDNRGYKLTASGMTLMQEACTHGQFCQETHKPGLCKGQHRGDAAEPNTPIRAPGDQQKIDNATRSIAGINSALRQLQAVMDSSTDPQTRRNAAKAMADYRKQLQPHLATVRQQQQKMKQNQQDTTRAKKVAQADEKQQDAINKRSKGKGGSTGLKPYQTSTKI